MPNLTVSAPQLTFDGVGPGLALLEKPVTVRCAGVTLPDGTIFDLSRLGKAGFFTYRHATATAPIQIWDQNRKLWDADPGGALTNFEPCPFIFKEDAPSFPWQGLLVAAAQKGQFEKVTGAFPQYFFRAYFASEVNGNLISGLSAPSMTVGFLSMLDAIRAGIKVGEGETPENATRVQLFLRDSSLHVTGSVEIKNPAGPAEIEVSNFNTAGNRQAVIRLHSNGDVEIQPAAGRSVIVNGSIEAQQIHYQPANAPLGTKQWLNTT